MSRPGWPDGHFYSPIPDPEEVERRKEQLFGEPPPALPGIELREAEQLNLLRKLGKLAEEQPWAEEAITGLLYRFENPNFQQGEAITLFAMLRQLRPRRIIEVGSGWSSCAILDTNELFLDRQAECVFVEPYPELLLELVKNRKLDIRATSVQEIEHELFTELAENDLLFIDSSHVVKVGSDVNYLILEILPRLRPGVTVHFHDIFYPFEYPQEWIIQGRYWNEAYLLRSFLISNANYRIELFLSYLAKWHRAELLAAFPPAARSLGSSLWLRCVSD
jgi:hypothetical protein